MMLSDDRVLLTVTLITAGLGMRNADLPNGGRPVDYDSGAGENKSRDVGGEEHEMDERHV